MSSESKKLPETEPAVTTSGGEHNIAQNPFPIVGVGASAGGLEAFTQLLSHLPKSTGMAFVLVQHLDPDHPSQLTNLLAKATSLPVREVADGMAPKPDHVYVIPPNANLKLTGGKLRLTPRGDERVPHQVDHFFSSLAQEQQSWAIGIILSGTGSDGSLGLKEIKAAGGITFAQDEKSARFSGMPLRAAGEMVDFVLPPEKIAEELARVGHDPYLAFPQQTGGEATEATEAGGKEFRRILALLRLHKGVDLSQYRDSTIKRRIQRRLLVRTHSTLGEYVEHLEKDRAEVAALFDDVLINVTSFFRDPDMYETLKARIFPEILKAAPPTIRVWVAACSTGQEAYSMAMALLEFLEQKPEAPGIQIFATDISESISIEKSRRGFYPESIEAEVSPERLRRFFTKEDGGYRISKTVRDLCIFARQNVAADPPFSRMDLVSCRNLLIYLTPALQRQVISTFHYALKPSGYLVLGSSETVGGNSDLFELVDRRQKIYLKKGAAIRPFPHFSAQDLQFRTTAAGQNTPLSSAPADFQKEADRILLGRYAPAGVLVNSNLEVLQFRGRTSPYLEPPTGEASFNLLKMARGNLMLELGTAIREVVKKHVAVRRNVRLNDHDTVRRVNLEVMPVKLPGSVESCFLILFEDAKKGRAAVPPPVKSETATKVLSATAKDRELKQLRAELAAAREYLQAITEQQDAANEELKCANEEVLSSNEELQSTNEQLGTAKEELQSTNEELQTLNEELQTRNTELNLLNNDLTNLLASVQIPILMLGSDLRIRRFNPAAIEQLHLKPAVIGRAIHAVELPFEPHDLEKLLSEVISRVVAKELEVRDREGHWFSLRMNPYRTMDNRIDGVILALVDIQALKKMQELQRTVSQSALTESEERFRSVADSAPVLIWISDTDKLFNWFNKPWLEFTGRTMEQESGNGWTNGVHPADLPKCLELYQKDFEARRNFQMEFRLWRQDGEYRWMLGHGAPRWQGTVFAGYIGSCIDITDRKYAEEKLAESLVREREAREAAELANHAKDDFLAALSHELRTPLNPALMLASDSANNHELAPGVRSHFEIIRKNIELEARLIDDLLDLTRISRGKLRLQKRTVDMHLVLQDAIDTIQAELEGKRLGLKLELKAERQLVNGDPARLQQVFWNVLKNAIKFTPKGGKVKIESGTKDGHWFAKITDTGIGITRDELGRIFSAFMQGDHGREKTHRFGGVGLGLSISRQLLELHSGVIQATSRGRGRGTTFIIELPLARRKIKNLPKPEQASEKSPAMPKAKKPGTRILLVEDHEATRDALASLLVRRQFRIQGAGSIAEARKVVNEEHIDFVISDIGLPDGNGNQLMQELSKSHNLKGIALTGYGAESDIDSNLAAGFLGHLTKPVTMQALEQALTKLGLMGT